MVNLNLFLTPDDSCSYLPDRRSRSLFVDPAATLNSQLYAQLLAFGFRRSGSHVYTTRCNNCVDCIPIRLPVDNFQPSRSQRRNRNMNNDLSMRQVLEITEEHVLLYQKYMEFRHHDSPMAHYDLEECRRFMLADWCETIFLEFRLKRKLVAVAVTDLMPDSLSAVYTYFDPDHNKRALGVCAILYQIEIARQLALNWLYLGFWIPQCKKMSYKVNYRPFELKNGKEWRFFESKKAFEVPSSENR